jgi:hypothetical protein
MVLIDWKVSMMKIVRSTSSCASAGGSNEAREAMRSGGIQAKGVVLPDDDGVSPNPARGELVSASLNDYRRPSSQETRSLPPTGKQRTQAPVGPVGVRGVSACQKNRQVTLGAPPEPPHPRQPVLGIHNEEWCLGVESDGLVVAEKRGNARGAKEPYCKHAFINEERAA